MLNNLIKQFTSITKKNKEELTDHLNCIKRGPISDKTTAVTVQNAVTTIVNTLTVNEDGLYLINAQTQFATNKNGHRSVTLQIKHNSNGSINAIGNIAHQAAPDTPTICQVFSIAAQTLFAGDEIQMKVYQTSGGSLNINTSYIASTRLK